MIDINYGVNEFNIKTNINSTNGKKILKLLNDTKNNDENKVKLTFNSNKSFNLKNILMSSNAKIIVFGDNFNTQIDLKKFTKLDSVIFGTKFNSSVTWSNSITKIYFSYYGKFNQPLNNLPKRLDILSLSGSFNQPLDNLPNGLENLTLYGSFNQPLNNLPNGLKNLILGDTFNQPLDFLPESLHKLEFEQYDPCFFSHSFENLPIGLETLLLPDSFVHNPNIDNLPNRIKNLRLPCTINKVPTNIIKLPDKIEKIEINLKIFKTFILMKNHDKVKELIIELDNYISNHDIIDIIYIVKYFSENNDMVNLKKITIQSNHDFNNYDGELNKLGEKFLITKSNKNYRYNRYLIKK